MNMTVPADSLTVAQAAAQMRSTEPTVCRWIHTGVVIGDVRVKLSAIRVGGQYLIPPAAVDAFIVACNPSAPPATESPNAIRRRCLADKAALAARLGG